MHQFNLVKIAPAWASILKTILVHCKAFRPDYTFRSKSFLAVWNWRTLRMRHSPKAVSAVHAIWYERIGQNTRTSFIVCFQRIPLIWSHSTWFSQSLSTLWTHQTRKCFGPDLSLVKSVDHIWTYERARERWLLTFSHLNRQIFA